MAELRHPSELNPLQRYRQARLLAKHTSRAKNTDWYANARDVDFQLHIRISNESIATYAYHAPSNTWQAGPSVSPDLIQHATLHQDLVQRTLVMALEAGARSLGVVLHIADEFVTAEIKPSLDNRDELPTLNAQIVGAPGNVLADAAADPALHSWRLLPYHGTGAGTIATAISLSKRCAALLDAFRVAGEANDFPIITTAVSAPLEVLAIVPWLWKPHDQRPLITVLHYSGFTVLAFFDASGELILVRTMQHRGQRKPSNLRHAASTTATVLELDQPDVLVLPLSDEAHPSIVQDLQQGLLDSHIRVVDWSETPFHHEGVATQNVEPLISAFTLNPSTPAGFGNNTFTSLLEDRDAFQNFVPTAEEIRAIYPVRAEMTLLGMTRIARVAAVAIACLGIAWLGLSWINLKSNNVDFDPRQNIAIQATIAQLNQEKASTEQWDRLLEDRSKAWPTMELLHVLFPEDSGVTLKKLEYRVTPITASGPNAGGGYSREWKISGTAQDQGIELLNALNDREGMNLRFDQVAKRTGNDIFKTNLPSRSLTINLKLTENTANRSEGGGSQYTFDLTINQRIEANDTMALTSQPTPPAPLPGK